MLTIQQLSFSYTPDKPILRNLDLTLAKGELLAIMGPSGCGKTTLLHLIAGTLRPTSGLLASQHTRLAYVFQEPRLFPWLTVEENLRAILPKKTPPAGIQEALAFVDLQDCAKLYPSELSGGMRMRLSLARALAYGGDLLLLDEPFAALDRELKDSLLPRLRQHLKENEISAILVTHQAEDAALFADRCLTLENGEALI